MDSDDVLVPILRICAWTVIAAIALALVFV